MERAANPSAVFHCVLRMYDAVIDVSPRDSLTVSCENARPDLAICFLHCRAKVLIDK